MKISCFVTTVFVFIVFSFMGSPVAAVIDFETTPGGGTPTDNSIIGLGDGYMDGGVTVTFGFDSDSDGTAETEAELEAAGFQAVTDPPSGFLGPGGVDTPEPDFAGQLGDFFLRSPSSEVGIGTDFGLFVIDYSAGALVTEASGEIWDIDGEPSLGTEQFLVTAFDSGGVELDSILSPLGNSSESPLGGQPWTFGFAGLNAGIRKITIDFVGTKIQGVGLAFNNFSAAENVINPMVVPEPSTFALATLGLLTLEKGLGSGRD